jgi:hypothetical protein
MRRTRLVGPIWAFLDIAASENITEPNFQGMCVCLATA